MKLKIILAMLLSFGSIAKPKICISNAAPGDTNYFQISGAWEVAANWSLGHVADSTEHVKIKPNIIATVQSHVSCKSFSDYGSLQFLSGGPWRFYIKKN
jgi:hypothetical protein